MFGLSADEAFFDLFDRCADNMVRTAELFHGLLSDFERRKEILGAIREAEHQGDSITHKTMTKLDQTFITPLDRGDIHDLVSKADDVVDMLDSAAKRIVLYGIEQPTEDIIKQSGTAVEITKALREAVKQLRNIKKQSVLTELLIKIHELENKGDEDNHAALARLFQSTDPIHVIKWKELYEIVESAIDACETVANTIRSIMVKNA